MAQGIVLPVGRDEARTGGKAVGKSILHDKADRGAVALGLHEARGEHAGEGTGIGRTPHGRTLPPGDREEAGEEQ